MFSPHSPVRQVAQDPTTTYTYDALGRRARSVSGGVTRNYHYDERDRLLYETNGSGGLEVVYLYHGKRLIAMRTAGGAVYYYHYDAIGNTVALTDASGATARAYRYGPFGEIVNQSGTACNPFTYVGAWGVMDEGNGLYLMRHRYYDAVASRFLQKDPIGFEGGSNLYAYVGNNPVNRIDPHGLFLFETAVVVGAAFAVWGICQIYEAGTQLKDALDQTVEHATSNNPSLPTSRMDPSSPYYDPDFRERYAEDIDKVGTAAGNMGKTIYGEAAGEAGDVIDVIELMDEE